MRKIALGYREIFARFGYPLGASDALTRVLLDRTEQRLGVKIPLVLREYAQVAGNESRFNRACHRLLHPSKWFTAKKHVVFMEENQNVCYWAVSIKNAGAKDPSVSRAAPDDVLEWTPECKHCSAFLTMVLHYNALSAYKFTGSATAPDDLHDRFKAQGWDYIGELNQMWVFGRQNQVVYVQTNSLPFMPAMSVMAGAKTKDDFRAIEESLAVKLQ